MNRKPRRALRFSLLPALLLGLSLPGCRKPAPPAPPPPAEEPAPVDVPESKPPSPATPAPTVIRAKPVPVAKRPPPTEIWKEFSGEKAYENVQKQVDAGPRASGTPDIEKARTAIEQSLSACGWDAELQEFTAATPRGPMKFVNIIGRFSVTGAHPAPKTTQQAIVCSHYDTKRFTLIKFVGACDGGSSTGALLELARVLALDPALAAKVELVFFDGEEAIMQFTSPDVPEKENDGLWGSRHYANELRDSGRARQFKFTILWDMIGDRTFQLTLPPNSPPELAKGIFDSADALGLRGGVRYFDRDILDDHVHLQRVRIPSIDLIDFDIPYWHTADDTIDKLTPESLQKVGEITLRCLTEKLAK